MRAPWLASLLSCFDDHPLLITHVETPLQLFAHRRVVRLEAGRQAGKSDVVDCQTSRVPRRQRCRRSRCLRSPCARSTRGQVETLRPWSRRLHTRRPRFLLDFDHWRRSTAHRIWRNLPSRSRSLVAQGALARRTITPRALWCRRFRGDRVVCRRCRGRRGCNGSELSRGRAAFYGWSVRSRGDGWCCDGGGHGESGEQAD